VWQAYRYARAGDFVNHQAWTIVAWLSWIANLVVAE
jgi:hypothetical protein